MGGSDNAPRGPEPNRLHGDASPLDALLSDPRQGLRPVETPPADVPGADATPGAAEPAAAAAVPAAGAEEPRPAAQPGDAAADGVAPEAAEAVEADAVADVPGAVSDVPGAVSDVPGAEAGADAEGAAEDAPPDKRADRKAQRELVRVTRERDDYLEQLKRTRADFENYRKRVLRQQTEHLERAAETLVEKLLPVLDNFNAAIAHDEGFEQVYANLMAILEKEGLTRIDPAGKPFDPNEADAVAHEAGDGEQVVSEVLRLGYRWKGRVLRPAMVRVRG